MEDNEELSNGKHSKNTEHVIERALKLFRQFCKKVKGKCDINKLSKSELNEILSKFWPSIRTENGLSLKKNSFKSVRYGIVAYFRKSRKIDINGDSEFSKSNVIYQAAVTSLNQEGHGATSHKEPLSKEDIDKLYDHPIVFSTNTPTGLMNKVFFEVMFYLCRRGRENLKEHKKSTFTIKTDTTGRRYVCHVVRALSKSDCVDVGPSDKTGEVRMYEEQGSLRCPVASFEKYLSKLHPKCSSLWQRPLNTYELEDNVWYFNAPLGKSKLFTSFNCFIVYKINIKALNYQFSDCRIIKDVAFNF